MQGGQVSLTILDDDASCPQLLGTWPRELHQGRCVNVYQQPVQPLLCNDMLRNDSDLPLCESHHWGTWSHHEIYRQHTTVRELISNENAVYWPLMRTQTSRNPELGRGTQDLLPTSFSLCPATGLKSTILTGRETVTSCQMI